VRSAALALLLACGCNQVFGIEQTVQSTVDADLMDADLRADIDADGLADVVDPCIAGPIDDLVDLDFDGIPNAIDPCPFEATQGDLDQDGVAGPCDMFAALPGDRRRCVMSFRDYDLNPLLWRPRPGQEGWDLTYMTTNKTFSGTIVAITPLEGTVTTTIEVYGTLGVAQSTAAGGTFRLIVRGSPLNDATDTGCEVTQRLGGLDLGTIPAAVTTTIRTTGSDFLLSATFVPSGTGDGANLRCTLDTLGGSSGSFSLKVEMPGGRVALSAANIDVTVNGLGVYERDDAPL
jgi:hypothetical protein